MNLYVVADKISGKFYEVFFSDTDSSAIRNCLPSLARHKPLNDIDIINVCPVSVDYSPSANNFGFNFGEFKFTSVNKDSYTFDEVTAQELSKTDAVKEIELMRKAREIQMAKLQKELQDMSDKISK